MRIYLPENEAVEDLRDGILSRDSHVGQSESATLIGV